MKTLRAIWLLLAFTILSSFTACSTTNYATYEGGAVVEGKGGAKTIVKGMEIWEDGAPLRKFRVIGIITDTRRQSAIGNSGFGKSLVKKAMKHGGDAIIILGSHTEIVGVETTGTINQFGSSGAYNSTSTVISDKETKAAVIRYVD